MYAMSDPGRVREHNEDSIRIRPRAGLAVLADGLGGHTAGEIASRTAVDVICASFATAPSTYAQHAAEAARYLRRAIEDANAEILRLARDKPACRSMGTTVVSALFVRDRVCIAHVGDSRAYRLRDHLLSRMTRDHSLVQEYLEQGILHPEEAGRSPLRHIVTRALGLSAACEVDLMEHPVRSGDLYLLCSDGLTDVVPDTLIRETLSLHHGNLKAGASSLVRLANTAGGPDNISVILARIP